MRWGRGRLRGPGSRGGKEGGQGLFYVSKSDKETVVVFAGEMSVCTISTISVTIAIVLRVLLYR